jgi:hypothetical protein
MGTMDIDDRIDALRASIQEMGAVMKLNNDSLHASIHELYETVQRNREEADRRIRAVENASLELKEMSVRLANIIIRHEERLDALDGGE